MSGVFYLSVIKHAFSMFYTLIKHGYSVTDQSAHRVQCILQTCIRYRGNTIIFLARTDEKSTFDTQGNGFLDINAPDFDIAGLLKTRMWLTEILLPLPAERWT